jgi:hypothetical protein
MTLFFDVLLDDFIGHVAARNAKVSARPEMATPEFLSQVWKLMHQLVGTLSLEHLEQPTNGQTRRHAHEQMNVIAGDVSFHNRDFVRAAYFADQLSKSCAYFTSHHWFAILRDPNDVEVDAKNSVCAMPIFCHGLRLYHALENLLKSSPKGEGFNPPRWGQ